MGLPVGAWALGGTLGLIACHLVLHTARPGLLERAVALVMIVVPGMICSVAFGFATRVDRDPRPCRRCSFLGTAFWVSAPLIRWLHGARREVWGQRS